MTLSGLEIKNTAKTNLFYFCFFVFIMFYFYVFFLIFRIIFGRTCYGTTVYIERGIYSNFAVIL